MNPNCDNLQSQTLWRRSSGMGCHSGSKVIIHLQRPFGTAFGIDEIDAEKFGKSVQHFCHKWVGGSAERSSVSSAIDIYN